ncbi:hypothetical protein RWE15_21075 [Virgibacillus halophilus]|uniref:Uncharacterized protein n=1 Tax=Tigheibacillus halophilus TaxID=361280 RepID=A0ABU5CCJ3_9BACI|nr:hypothetical protein [Virgibacillus halophilus]
METMATLFKHSIRPTSMKSGFTKDMTDTDTFGAALDASQTQGLTTGMEGGESKPAYGKTEINSAGNEAMTADILAEPFIEKLIDFLKQTDGKTKTKEIDMDDLSVMLAEMPKQLQDIAAKLFQHDSELSGVPQTELSFQNDLKTKWTELLDSLKVNGRQDSPIDMPMLADSEEAATSGASRVKETVNTHHMQAILEEGKELLSQVAKILQVLDKGGDVNREAQKSFTISAEMDCIGHSKQRAIVRTNSRYGRHR